MRLKSYKAKSVFHISELGKLNNSDVLFTAFREGKLSVRSTMLFFYYYYQRHVTESNLQSMHSLWLFHWGWWVYFEFYFFCPYTDKFKIDKTGKKLNKQNLAGKKKKCHCQLFCYQGALRNASFWSPAGYCVCCSLNWTAPEVDLRSV